MEALTLFGGDDFKYNGLVIGGDCWRLQNQRPRDDLKNWNPKMGEVVFDGNYAKLTYRGYDDLLFWQGRCETYWGWKTTANVSGKND